MFAHYVKVFWRAVLLVIGLGSFNAIAAVAEAPANFSGS